MRNPYRVVIVTVQSKITGQWNYCPQGALPMLGRALEYDDKPSGYHTSAAALAAASRDPSVPKGAILKEAK